MAKDRLADDIAVGDRVGFQHKLPSGAIITGKGRVNSIRSRFGQPIFEVVFDDCDWVFNIVPGGSEKLWPTSIRVRGLPG